MTAKATSVAIGVGSGAMVGAASGMVITLFENIISSGNICEIDLVNIYVHDHGVNP